MPVGFLLEETCQAAKARCSKTFYFTWAVENSQNKDSIAICQYKFETKNHYTQWILLMKKKMQMNCFVNQNTT